MAKKKINPVLENILRQLDVDETADVALLKRELLEKKRRALTAIRSLGRGLRALQLKREKDAEQKDFKVYLRENKPLAQYLAKKLKEIL